MKKKKKEKKTYLVKVSPKPGTLEHLRRARLFRMGIDFSDIPIKANTGRAIGFIYPLNIGKQK